MTEGLPRKGAPMTDQVTPLGSPVATNGMAWLTPMAEASGVRLRTMGLAVPLTLMTWGEVAALSVRVMVSERAPESEGVKLTTMSQVPMEAMEPLQLLVVEKSLELVPPTTTEVMLRAPVPELVTTIVVGVPTAPWEMAGKVTGLGAMVTAGAGGGGILRPPPPPQPAAKGIRKRTQKKRAYFPHVAYL